MCSSAPCSQSTLLLRISFCTSESRSTINDSAVALCFSCLSVVSSADWGNFGASREPKLLDNCSVHFYAKVDLFVQVLVLYSLRQCSC